MVSPDIERFLDSAGEQELGLGLHIFEAFNRDAWRRIATEDSRGRLIRDLAPIVMGDVSTPLELGSVSDQVAAVLRETDPRPFTRPLASSFDYVEPRGDSELPVMRVNMIVMPLYDGDRDFIGALVLGYMALRPGLVSLLARGDETMYERMATLVEPASREGAILFCDLAGSTELAHGLATGRYFRLIRNLWTEIDALVANNRGIIGKHAGDGATAFFLVDDLGSPSSAASAALQTARAIHERSEGIFGDSLETSCLMRVGLHWGSSLYIGQLVPGGRLDVTALGDAVNECARIQELARPHETLASKELVERLSGHDAAALGIDPDKMSYRPLSEVQPPQSAPRGPTSIPVAVV